MDMCILLIVKSINSEGTFGTLITELIIFIGQCDYVRSVTVSYIPSCHCMLYFRY